MTGLHSDVVICWEGGEKTTIPFLFFLSSAQVQVFSVGSWPKRGVLPPALHCWDLEFLTHAEEMLSALLLSVVLGRGKAWEGVVRCSGGCLLVWIP